MKENITESFHSTHAALKKFGYRGGGKDGEWSSWIEAYGRGKNKIMLHKDGEEWVNHSPDNPGDVLASGRGRESLDNYLNKYHKVPKVKDNEKKTVKEEIISELKLRPFSDYENWKKEAETRGLRIHVAGTDDWQRSDKEGEDPYLYIARDKMGNRHGKFNQSTKSGHLREDLYMPAQELQEDYKSGKKVFAHLDDTPDNHRHRIIHSLSAYDATQQQRAAANPRAYHNPHALNLYMKSADEAYQSMKAGMAPADAINNHFVGYVADRLHKHLGTGGSSVDSQRRKMFGESKIVRHLEIIREAKELEDCPNCGAKKTKSHPVCLNCLKPIKEGVDEYGEISPFGPDDKKKEDQKQRLRKKLKSFRKRRSVMDDVADAIGLRKYKHPDGGYRYEEYAEDGSYISESNKPITHAIEHGDHVTIVDRFGQKRSGKAVMRSSHGGWVLNMGGRHGTPGLADDDNIVHVRKVRRTPEKDLAHKLLGNVREEKEDEI